MRTVRVIVHGWVQGVGFRAFTQREAMSRGITGSVWNRDDDRVELVATGEKDMLKEFIELLRNGPGCVVGLDIEDLANTEFQGFVIVGSP